MKKKKKVVPIGFEFMNKKKKVGDHGTIVQKKKKRGSRGPH